MGGIDMMQARACAFQRGALVVAAVLLLALLGAPRAAAQGQVDIQSSGPLTNIWIGDDLRCQVAHTGEDAYQFYSSGSTSGNCGTLLSVGGASGAQLYGFLGSSWTPVSQSGLAGSGTSSDPYRVTTVVQTADPGLTLTEVDSYVVGSEYYRTDVTVANASADTTYTDLKLYHAADCYLQGSDSGFGFVDANNRAVACAQNPSNTPPAMIEEFAPLTAGSHYMETYYGSVFSAVRGQTDLPDTCDCNGDPSGGGAQDNGMGINWNIGSLAPGQSANYSLLSSFSLTGITAFPISASGGRSFTGTAPATITGTLASFTDPNSSDPASVFSATVDWGDGARSAGTITGGQGSFAVTGSHTYTAPGTYQITVTINHNGGTGATVTDSATVTPATTVSATSTSAPTPVLTGAATVNGSSAAGFTGSVNPAGLPTTAVFQYGLDPKYSGGGAVVYTDSTPAQAVGGDFSSHNVFASVGGLVPNALYHVRLVATNSAGTSFGSDTTFTTLPAPAPRNPPALGQTFNIAPVSGVVLVKVGGQFVPLTQLRQIPHNAQINALHGTLQIITASGGGPSGARDAAAKGKKGKTKTKTQKGTFGGAVFRLNQAKRGRTKGLVTLTLLEGVVKGGPTYAACKAGKAGEASAAASRKTLQLLRASAKGKFSTRGKYAAATVRGTKWSTADRCDGTLIRDITHSVTVTDLARHKTIILHAGQSYLANPRKQT
jgi:hypothetical protein